MGRWRTAAPRARPRAPGWTPCECGGWQRRCACRCAVHTRSAQAEPTNEWRDMRRPEGQVDAREFVEASPRVMRAVECGHTLGSASIVFSANAAGKEYGRRRRQRGRAVFGSHEWDSGLRLRLPSGAKFVTAPADPPSLGIRPQRRPMHTPHAPAYLSLLTRADRVPSRSPSVRHGTGPPPTNVPHPPVPPWQRSAAVLRRARELREALALLEQFARRELRLER